MNANHKPLPSLPSTTPTLSSTIDKDSSGNGGNIDAKDDIGDLWAEGRVHRGQVLEYLGIGPGILDGALDEMGRVLLPALATTTSSLDALINLGAISDVASMARIQGRTWRTADTQNQLKTTDSISFAPPLSIMLRTEQRWNNARVWDGQVLVGKQGRTGSSPTAPESDMVRFSAEDKGSHVGRTFAVITSNPESEREIQQNSTLYDSPTSAASVGARFSRISLNFPSPAPMPSPITLPCMTSSPVEMESVQAFKGPICLSAQTWQTRGAVAVDGIPSATLAKDVPQGVCPGRAGSSSTVAEASL
ncbi:uncharacterized protein ARMOST_19370 [Armillaria ostoyae]|uniref:Uncharacterized protein n=1 Tax=Armillaria ostoyae TaxID=47428 RepID=A0A284S4C6_ARMOS|nr:uncharacterized protein ARMOST_19370 [Armillaria ostoyae]